MVLKKYRPKFPSNRLFVVAQLGALLLFLITAPSSACPYDKPQNLKILRNADAVVRANVEGVQVDKIEAVLNLQITSVIMGKVNARRIRAHWSIGGTSPITSNTKFDDEVIVGLKFVPNETTEDWRLEMARMHGAQAYILQQACGESTILEDSAENLQKVNDALTVQE